MYEHVLYGLGQLAARAGHLVQSVLGEEPLYVCSDESVACDDAVESCKSFLGELGFPGLGFAHVLWSVVVSSPLDLHLFWCGCNESGVGPSVWRPCERGLVC